MKFGPCKCILNVGQGFEVYGGYNMYIQRKLVCPWAAEQKQNITKN